MSRPASASPSAPRPISAMSTEGNPGSKKTATLMGCVAIEACGAIDACAETVQSAPGKPAPSSTLPIAAATTESQPRMSRLLSPSVNDTAHRRREPYGVRRTA